MLRLLLSLSLLLAACVAPPGAAPLDVLLLGEQHDDPVHQREHRATIDRLAAQGRLAAVVLEMADQGASTASLPPTATEEAARTALRWNQAAWPWGPYAPAVMAAVREGVPVLGGNLPRERLRGAMGDGALDATLGPEAWQAQRDAIRAGHCDLLPASQLDGMVRVQVARDRSLAHAIVSAAVPGKTVVLLAGRGHVDAVVGVPRHLPTGLRVESLAWPASGQAPATDHCAQLREQMRRRPMS